MIYFTAHTFKCVCHCRKAMFRVLGMYNFGIAAKEPFSMRCLLATGHSFLVDYLTQQIIEKKTISESLVEFFNWNGYLCPQ